MYRQFFRKLSQNRDFIQTFCNDRRNPVHFACRQWYLYNSPQVNMVYLHEVINKYWYKSLCTCMNNVLSISRKW